MKRQKLERLLSLIFIGGVLMTLVMIVALEIRKIEIKAEVTETDASLTDTGALIALEMERSDRAYGFLLRIQSRAKARESFSLKQLERRRKLVAHQLECKDEIRRANRDTKLLTLLRCYRTNLTLNLESLRKERLYIENIMVGLTEGQKGNAYEELDNLVDAITTVINGIDAGVYTSQNGLEEVKTSLMKRYWTPWWHEQLKLHADRLISWIAHLIIRIDAISEANDMLEEDQILLANTRACLTDEETRLKAAISSLEYEETNTKLQESYENIMLCLGEAPAIQPEEEPEEPTEESEDQLAPRRDTGRIRYWE